jgi:hypothetical protein
MEADAKGISRYGFFFGSNFAKNVVASRAIVTRRDTAGPSMLLKKVPAARLIT